MVQWGDATHGLRAAARLMVRGGFWWTLVCRALFSRVTLSYLALGFGLGFAGALALRSAGQIVWPLLLLGVMPGLMLVLTCVLLPYCVWIFQPAAAHFLARDLPLPPAEVDEELSFGDIAFWSLPAMGWLLLMAIAVVVRPFLSYVMLAFAVLSLLKLGVRSALAGHYAPDTVARFLAATRWQRVLVWAPLLIALSWGFDMLWRMVVSLFGYGVPMDMAMTPGGAALFALLNTLYWAFVGAAMVGTLLLACARARDGHAPTQLMADLETDTVLEPDTVFGPDTVLDPAPAPSPTPPRPAAPAPRAAAGRLGLAAALLAAVASAAWFGRLPLVDAALSLDARYQNAAEHNAARIGPYPALAGDGAHRRLRRGLIAYACQGVGDRAEWLWKLGVQEDGDLQWALACAACGDYPDGMDWVLAKAPESPLDLVVHPSGMPRTALGCAASNNNLSMAALLLRHGADPLQPQGADSALHIAVQRRQLPMVLALLGEEPDAQALLALDVAAGMDRRFARELFAALAQRDLRPVRDAWGRTALHWVAQQDDAEVAAALPPALVTALSAERDRQGATAWMHVLRRAQLREAPVDLALLQRLLQRLLPADGAVGARPSAAPPGMPRALPAHWNPAQAALNDAPVRVVLGHTLDYGQLSAEPREWWRFRDEAAAAAFIADLSADQLLRAEQPEAPAGVPPQALSAALEARGWHPLAANVRAAALRAATARGRR